jgi:hypothetical protein
MADRQDRSGDHMNVKKLRRLRERYEAALDEAESRRGEYHEAISEAHLSGTTLRQIASELGLSHQRVHQIVESHRSDTKPHRRTGKATSEPAVGPAN